MMATARKAISKLANLQKEALGDIKGLWRK
jgi:hypothetical protein